MRLTPRQRGSVLTLAWGLLLGLTVLGLGGRIAMRIIAEATTGSSGFTVGGTATVFFLGAVSGGLGAVILVVARHCFWRHRPATTVCFWIALGLLTWRGLRPVDHLRVLAFAPVMMLFGVTLQAVTFRYRPSGPLSA